MTQTLTAKGRATRQRIIEAAAEEFRERGVAATTLDDILARTRTSKGQLFHYFSGGREELLLAVAGHEAERVLADQQPHLGALTSWEDWRQWRDTVVDRYGRQGDQCALSMLITQIGRATPAARILTNQLLQRWQGDLAAGLRRMQDSGEVERSLDPDRTAAALIAALQGGVVVLMTTGRADSLEAGLDLVLDHIQSHAKREALIS